MRLLLAITADSFRIKYRIVMKAFLDYDNSTAVCIQIC